MGISILRCIDSIVLLVRGGYDNFIDFLGAGVKLNNYRVFDLGINHETLSLGWKVKVKF